jgi:HTH-type transcriptional regulator, sugar sensing transcriptional regulator
MVVVIMPEMIESLKKHGFTEYEAKAYVALVGLGMATAREICEVSGVPQGRIYTVLKVLADSGYIEIQDGTPTFYHAQDPVEAFRLLKEEYCNAIDNSVLQLKKLHFEAKPPSPFWSIHSDKGIRNRLKMLIRNAEEDLIIFAQDPYMLRLVHDDLKTAGKRVNLSILVPDKGAFAGLNLRVYEMSEPLADMFVEMAQKSSKMRKVGWKTDLFMIIDGMDAITVGSQSGNRVATVISMPPVCFMMKKLIEMLDPVVAG